MWFGNSGFYRTALNPCSALQIFMKESHPSVYKSGKGSTKEGLSLFGKETRLDWCTELRGKKMKMV